MTANLATPLIHTYLEAIQVVMVNTTLPANIGSAARAMHTMGLSRLVVVNPKHPIDESSVSHAAGGQQLLKSCQVVDTLEAALAKCHLVFAASSRNRHIPRPVVTPTQAAQISQQFIDQSIAAQDNYHQKDNWQPNIAIIFGREDRGLTNDELACADYHIQIDANPDYPVLNVASAIQVIASFFYAHFLQHSHAKQTDDKKLINPTSIHPESINQHIANQSTSQDSKQGTNQDENILDSQVLLYLRQTWDEPAITQQQQAQLQQRIIDLMHNLQLVDLQDLRLLPNRLARLTARLQLDQKEYQLINAIIAQLQRQLNLPKE